MNQQRMWTLKIYSDTTPTNWSNVLNNKDSSLTKFTDQDNLLNETTKSNTKVEKYNDN